MMKLYLSTHKINKFLFIGSEIVLFGSDKVTVNACFNDGFITKLYALITVLLKSKSYS